jgi:hypothetical protein
MWLMVVGIALGFLLLGGAVYYWLEHSGSTSAEKPATEAPAAAAKQNVTNPLQKYVEVVGLRTITDKNKPVAKFIVVNHSGSEIDGLEANVTMGASTSRSDEDSIGSFSFKIASLGANESKELTAPLKTKLKMYELPDWQKATVDVQITSPQQ